ncbi:MAG: universal stress protein [Terrimicrobiaceae bacterium]|jgi:nucleotide-binding universal stress UspA family protein
MPAPHFAVASAFSPRFRALIFEADRVSRMFGARLSVLHAGDRTDEKVQVFHDIFADLGREEVDIFWCEGSTPAEALVDAAASEKFDLFIAGTIARPEDLRNFTGTVVRELVTRTPCDLLLIPDPREEEIEELSVCLLVEAHRPRWRAAVDTLKSLKPARITVLAADSPFARVRQGGGAAGEEGTLEQVLAELEPLAGDIDLRRVQSNTGFVLCDILQEEPHHFLLVESEWKNRQRTIPPHLGWLEQVVPGRLFLFGKPPRGVKETTTLVPV